MMRNMRKHMRVILWFVVAAFVGTIFFVWGMDMGRRGDVMKLQSAAVVNDQAISYPDFGRLWDEHYRRFFGNSAEEPDPQEIQRQRRELIAGLIDQLLLRQEFEKLQLRVFPEEVAVRIASLPAFQDQGQFSHNKYLSVLDYHRLSTGEFEAEQRNAIAVIKMRQFLRDSVVVTESAVRNYFLARSRKLKLHLVVFNWKAGWDKITIPESKLKNHYQEHQSAFDQPAEVRASHILVSAGDQATEEEKLTAKIKLENLKHDILQGADFAEIAREHSDDPGSKEKGGDLGFFRRGTMVPAFEKVAFKLKPGMISDPVETPFGYHLIKVGDRREEKKSSFAGVRKDILKLLKERAAKQSTQKAALAFQSRLQKTTRLGQAAAQAQVRLKTTPWLREGSPIPGIEQSEDLLDQAFNLSLRTPSSHITCGELICFVEVAEEQYRPFNEKLYQLERETSLANLIALRAEETERDWLQWARQHAKITNNILTEDDNQNTP
jgi:peptidyl-prolyl cis-trans isomerase D